MIPQDDNHPLDTGESLWASAVYEASVRWNGEAVEKVKDALRRNYPYIDESTPEEVMRFAVRIWFDKA